MKIDWFTLIAQIINFLILLFILKKVLFERVVEAMRKRENRIAEQIQRAKQKEKEAETLEDALQKKAEDWEREKKNRENELKDEITEKRKRWADEAREEVAAKRQAWMSQLKKDRREFKTIFQETAVDRIFHVCGKVLRDLADQDLETAITGQFCVQIHHMDDSAAARLYQAVNGDDTELLLESRFGLDAQQRGNVEAALSERLDRPVTIRSVSNDQLSAGIMLKAGDWVLEWHAGRYLDELQTIWQEMPVMKNPSGGASEQKDTDHDD